MNTVFLGGSRHISRLPAPAIERLRNITDLGAHVVVGDANGADKAVQRFLQDHAYSHVTVFCSGKQCCNNLGQWSTKTIDAPKNVKGFAFYAIKDRAMARQADYGLMIWDGKSPGTVLNILRLIRAGKKAVLVNGPDHTTTTFKSPGDWDQFVANLDPDLREDLRKRATPEEWLPSHEPQQTSFLDPTETPRRNEAGPETDDMLVPEMNAALASGDTARIVDTLGNIARARGMTRIADDTGLARESLYRSLSSGGNPEFTTILKVMSSIGLQLSVSKTESKSGD